MSTFINFNIYKKTFKSKKIKKLEKNIEKNLKEQQLINKITEYWYESIPELSYKEYPSKEIPDFLLSNPYDPPNHGRTYVTPQLEEYLSDDQY